MKNFSCWCGSRVFFDNDHCINCGRKLAFDPRLNKMLSIEQIDQEHWYACDHSFPKHYRLCKNALDYNEPNFHVCNWVVATEENESYCLGCRLNRTIPNLNNPKNKQRWKALEVAKKRLLYSLLNLNLPIISKRQDAENGLAFDFLEDKCFNPNVAMEYVITGHVNGLITLNVAEADDFMREAARQAMNESYRTLLGHFRHESGHYYWEQLVKDSHWMESFRHVFGDERQDYSTALQTYYNNGPREDWQHHFISAYAQSHPLEDWAESWAHYLHMIDTVETAHTFKLVPDRLIYTNFDTWIKKWMELIIAMNALNRSMGLNDAYPFVLSNNAIEKLRFIHKVIAIRFPIQI